MTLKNAAVTIQAALAYYGMDKPRYLVETGTFRFGSTRLFSGIFSRVITIELSPIHWSRALRKFGCRSNVVPLFGDSAIIVPILAITLQEPVVWYLDAHWFGFEKRSFAHENPCPLADELKGISGRQFRDLIVIDDYHAFGNTAFHDKWKNLTAETVLDLANAVEATVLEDAYCMVT